MKPVDGYYIKINDSSKVTNSRYLHIFDIDYHMDK